MKTIMNKKSVFKRIILVLLVIGVTISCNDDNDDVVIVQDPLNITETAIASSDLSNLVAALIAADGDLVSVLNGTGPFTVLAPTNLAFQNFLTAKGFASLSDVPKSVLSQILLNHVISGTVKSTDLISAGSGYAKTNANGAGGQKLDLFFDTSNGVKFNGVATVTTANIEASNGVIHVMDEVIDLPTIVTHAIANPNLSSLVSALTSNGNTTFTDLLSSAGDFTVFAPLNSGFTSFTNPRNNALNSILENHVIVGATALSSGLENGYANTAATFNDTDNNLSIYINTDNSVVTLNGVSKVEAADIIATNGVIHVVDKVIDLPTIVDFAIADPNFSILVSALTRSDLTFDFVSTLSTPIGTSPAPFTVFAPTNTAFLDLLAELNVSALADISEPTLKATLNHHAVAANVRSAALTDNMTVGTLGGNITANIAGGATLTDANNRISKIVAVDVQANNGVIHVIDKVILPNLN